MVLFLVMEIESTNGRAEFLPTALFLDSTATIAADGQFGVPAPIKRRTRIYTHYLAFPGFGRELTARKNPTIHA